jgi:hypothetical protein
MFEFRYGNSFAEVLKECCLFKIWNIKVFIIKTIFFTIANYTSKLPVP